MDKIAIIASSAFVREGLSAEFGRIPPCLLPLGNDHLLYHQVELMKNFADQIFVSLPNNYKLHNEDISRIYGLGVQIVYTDPRHDIGNALISIISSIGIYDAQLYVIYGDTLFTDLSLFPVDTISVHPKWGEYTWGDLGQLRNFEPDKHHALTLSGLFSFSSIPKLLSSLTCENADIVTALVRYDSELALNLCADGIWYDFGHLQTYYRSVGLVTTERSFNTLNIGERHVRKSSDRPEKILSEAKWFENIPSLLKIYTPAYLGIEKFEEKDSYITENTYLSTISNLAVFGDLQTKTWDRIFDSCHDFLLDCSFYNLEKPTVFENEYFQSKTAMRLDEFFSSELGRQIHQCSKISDRAVPQLDEILNTTSAIIGSYDHGRNCIIHGDFCFSNIFYNFRSSLIKVIDPRGMLPDGKTSIYGLQSYDISKLAHSALGGYDLIIANYMSASISDTNLNFDSSVMKTDRWQRIVSSFQNSKVCQSWDGIFIDAMVVHLFLSMLPLHSDRPDRQLSMFAMAHQIYQNRIG